MIKSKKDFEDIVQRFGILKVLEPFHALWVGTIPIEVHIETSDVNIICMLEDRLLKQSGLNLLIKRNLFEVFLDATSEIVSSEIKR